MRSYNTIASSSRSQYKEKGSKFLGFAYPVDALDEVKKRVDQLKKEYYDARHHCYAYLIENGHQPLVRANDDGEPNHSAGDPILGQIRSLGLTNTLVVVVRYFGGTKLGVSGLIHAYKTAAAEALQNAKIQTVEIKQEISITYSYEKTNDVMRILNDYEVGIKAQDFQEECTLIGRIDPEQFQSLKDKLARIEVGIIAQ